MFSLNCKVLYVLVSSAAAGRTTVVAIITTMASAVTLPTLQSRRRRDVGAAHSMSWSDAYRLSSVVSLEVDRAPLLLQTASGNLKRKRTKDFEINYCTLVPLFPSNRMNFAKEGPSHPRGIFITNAKGNLQKELSPLIFSLNRRSFMIEPPDGAIENEFPAVNFKYDLFICHGIHYQVGGAHLISRQI